MTLWELVTDNARDEFARTRPAPLREIAEAERRTHYAIRRTSDGAWWLFESSFHANHLLAQRFASMTMAELTGQKEIPGDLAAWSVEAVEGA